METIMTNGWTIKLTAVRLSDGVKSRKEFDFNYVPEDYYVPCIFCEYEPDGPTPARLPQLIGPARPGVKKRRMPEPKLTFAATAKALRMIRKHKLPHLESVLSSSLPTSSSSSLPSPSSLISIVTLSPRLET